MKLHTDGQQLVEKSENLTTSAFSIKKTAKAFSILSSNLYSDKILAIIRELSCNAYDAHVAAGKSDVPFEIKLPTALDTLFYVKDFGIGLDHDGVMNLYTTYFDSTKTDSDDFVGQLGLGSKSPFAYTQSFSVESRFNGIKRQYSAFIDDEGMPVIALLNKASTDETNGLTVSLNVNRNDVSKFIDAAKKALMYFDPQPKVAGCSGFESYGISRPATGDGWKLRETTYYARMTGPYVIQGFVAYPLSVDILAQHGLDSNLQRELVNVDVDLMMPIGSVDVAASREALSYDRRTVKNVLEYINNLVNNVQGAVQAQVDTCSTLWDAIVKYDDLIKTRGLSKLVRASNTPITWNGIDLSDDVFVKMDDLTCKIRVAKPGRHSNAIDFKEVIDPNMLTSDIKGRMFRPNPTFHLFVANIPNWSRVAKRVISNKERALIVVPPTRRSVDIAIRDAQKIAQRLGGATVKTFIDVDVDVDDQKTHTTYYRAKKIDEVLVWTGFEHEVKYQNGKRITTNYVNRKFSRLCWNNEKVDLKAGGVYVPIKRFTAFKDKVEGTTAIHIDTAFEQATTLNIIPEGTKLYGLTEKQLKVINTKKWKNLYDIIEQQLEGKLAGLVEQYATKRAVLSIDMSNAIELIVVKDWNQISMRFNNGAFKTFFDYVASIANTNNKLPKMDAFVSLAQSVKGFDFEQKVKQRQSQLETQWNQMIRQSYPMLGLISLSNLKYMTGALDKIIDYVNQCESV